MPSDLNRLRGNERDGMQSLQPLLGIVAILGFAWLISENRSAVSWRRVIIGIVGCIVLAALFLKLPPVQALAEAVADLVQNGYSGRSFWAQVGASMGRALAGFLAGLIAGYEPLQLLPAHGSVVREGRRQLLEYITKLRRLSELYLRGYDIQRFAGCDQDNVSRPTSVPHAAGSSLSHRYRWTR